MALERNTYTPPPRDARQQRAACKRVVAVAPKALGARPAGAAVSADLGGSSKYSSENLED